MLPKEKVEDSFAKKIVRIYDKLYDIERELKGRSPRVIKRVRNTRSRKILNRIYRLIEGHSVRPSSLLGGAIQYMKNHKSAFMSYLSNPHVPISNILTEHVAKKIALARKNFLFCVSSQGADSLANLMSIVYTASLYKKHNLFDYLTMLFTELPKAKTFEDMEKLLPWVIQHNEVATFIANRPKPPPLKQLFAA